MASRTSIRSIDSLVRFLFYLTGSSSTGRCNTKAIKGNADWGSEKLRID
jgi:hypothetical protein